MKRFVEIISYLYPGFVLFGYVFSSSLASFLQIDGSLLNGIYKVAVVLLAVVLLFYLMWGKFTMLHFMVTIFILIYSCRLVFDTLIRAELISLTAVDYFVRFFGFCIIPILPILKSSAVFRTNQDRILLLFGWLAGGAILITGNPEGGQYRFSGNEFLNPISTGTMGAILFGMCVSRIIKLEKSLIDIIGACIGMYIVVISGSRGPFLASILVGLIILLLRLNIVGKLAIAAIIASIPLWFSHFNVDLTKFAIIDRLDSTLSAADNGDIRIDLLSAAWNKYLEHPVIGSSLDLFEYQTHPHNLLAEAFMTTGTIGGLIFVLVWLISLFICIYCLNSRVNNAISVIGIVYLATSLFSGSISNSVGFWICVSLLCGISLGAFRNSNTRLSIALDNRRLS